MPFALLLLEVHVLLVCKSFLVANQRSSLQKTMAHVELPYADM